MPKHTGATKRSGRALLLAVWMVCAPYTQAATRELTWDDIPLPIQALLIKNGMTGAGFPGYLTQLRQRNRNRQREGDLDHLIYYLLQSSSFTRLPAIEPAESAAQFVSLLSVEDRARFLDGEEVASAPIPGSAKARIGAFAAAIARGGTNTRLAYFRDWLAAQRSDPSSLRTFLTEQYVRAMRFLYEKEFVQKGRPPTTAATLYQSRGLSTDTSADAGFVVYLALGALRQLEPSRRIERALVIGPGLDFAPRTGLVETGEPQSYQPFAVIDALLGAGLAEASSLRVSALDINPRVVSWLREVRGTTPRLALHPGIGETDRVRLTDDYRTYFSALGKQIGVARPIGAGSGAAPMAKSLTVSSAVTSAVDAAIADITVERFDERYDLIVVTNVFPYLSDEELLLAISNVSKMLKPGGVLLHNEPRPLLADATLALRLTLIHSRSAVIATVAGGSSPLYDAIWMHRASE